MLQFSVRGPNALLTRGFGGQERELVAHVDSELNQWFDSIPRHRESLIKVRLIITDKPVPSPLGSMSRRRTLVPPIWPSLLPLLSCPNYGPSSICHFKEETRWLVLCCSGYVHKCGTGYESCITSNEHSTARVIPVYARMFFQWLALLLLMLDSRMCILLQSFCS
jgi:hypothetical protein